MIAQTSRRESSVNPLAESETITLTLTLPEGPVVLHARGDGMLEASGSATSRDALLAMGELTVFTDTANKLRAYPGHPASVVAVAFGHVSQAVPRRARGRGPGSAWIQPTRAPATSGSPPSPDQALIRRSS